MTPDSSPSPFVARMLHEESFQPRVFWIVNALLLTLLLIVLVWCFRGGAEKISNYLTREAGGLSDAAYLERVRERRERQAQVKKQSPEERLASLKTSFQRNKVSMVVDSNDFVEESVVEVIENEVDREPELGHSEEVGSSCDGKMNETYANESSVVENGARIDEESGAAVFVEPFSEERVCMEGQGRQEANPLAVELGSPDEENATHMGTENVNSVELGTFDTEEDCSEEDDNVITQQDQTFAMNAVETGAPGYIKLRLSSGKKRTVPNCCAVCLCSYEEGETIVWSSNRACKHAFHEECVMEWLIKMQDGTPCPCCRQEFTDVDHHKKKQKKILVDPQSFDIRVIRL